jgi:hypothetical protein
MKSSDQSLLISAKPENADTVVEKVIKRCITEGWAGPREYPLGQMTSLDRFAVLMNIRLITYGPEYKFSAICPYCGAESDYVVNLTDIPVTYADDDFAEPFTTTLPICGSTIEWRLLRGDDETALRAHKRAKKGTLKVDPTHEFHLARRLISVNGKIARNIGDSLKFVKELHARDELEWSNDINAIEIGVETEFELPCKNFDCERRHETSMPMSEDFFRPGLAGEPETADIFAGGNRISYDGIEDELRRRDQLTDSAEGPTGGKDDEGDTGEAGCPSAGNDASQGSASEEASNEKQVFLSDEGGETE